MPRLWQFPHFVVTDVVSTSSWVGAVYFAGSGSLRLMRLPSLAGLSQSFACQCSDPVICKSWLAVMVDAQYACRLTDVLKQVTAGLLQYSFMC